MNVLELSNCLKCILQQPNNVSLKATKPWTFNGYKVYNSHVRRFFFFCLIYIFFFFINFFFLFAFIPPEWRNTQD